MKVIPPGGKVYLEIKKIEKMEDLRGCIAHLREF